MNDTATVERWDIAGGVSLGGLFKIFSDTTSTSEEDFEEALATATEMLDTHGDAEWVVALAGAAVALFNADDVRRAGRLFSLAVAARRRLDADPEAEAQIEAAVSSAQLDVGRFLTCVGDPSRRDHVAPVLHFFKDFRAAHLLDQLLMAESERRRSFLVNAIALQGEEAVLPLLNCLDWPEIQQHRTPLLVDLLAILAQLPAVEAEARPRAATLAGQYATHDNAEVRAAALGALERIGGREILVPVMRALKASAYSDRVSQKDLCPHLGAVLRLLAYYGDERALMVVAEAATGGRDFGFKLGHALEEAAIEALRVRTEPLPPRAARIIAERLEGVAGKRFRLMAGKLVHPAEIRRVVALVSLLEDSTDTRIQHLLLEPGLRSLV